jgi:hypothetical protein
MTSQRAPTEWLPGVAPGRLRWKPDGTGLATRTYRIRLLGPGRWETTYRGAPISIDQRRSVAVAKAEQHYAELRRQRQVVGFGVGSGISLVVAITGLITMTPLGYFVFVAGFGLFLGLGARSVAASTRNLLDPYRIRESWEPPDWWNR